MDAYAKMAFITESRKKQMRLRRKKNKGCFRHFGAIDNGF